MRLYRQLLGIRVFSVEPYQLGGSGNEEGIQSGAFWFYRKLGFRPVRPDLARLVEREEQKIASRKGYRTNAPTLRRLASGHVLYEAPSKAARAGEWDRFHVRNLGLAVTRRAARGFNGDTDKLRAASAAEVTRALGASREEFDEETARAFSNFALVLSLVPDLDAWPREDKRAVVQIVRAKAGRDETAYLRLLRRHTRLRRAIIALGTKARANPKPVD